MGNRKAVSGTVLLLMAAVVAASAQGEPADEVEATAAAWTAAIDRVAPEGYLFEELRRCAGCHEPSVGLGGNSTHRNAIGLTGDPSAPALTGKGWLSGGHGRSQDASIVSNTFCAWCHAPSQPGVTRDISAAEPIVTGKAGVSCIACHASEAVNEEFGHYQANFRPGGDRDSLVDFVPRDPESGAETNDQCLFCHLRPHAFSYPPHAYMVESGKIRCIDCHMAVYNVTESGREERYHNMKVAANEDPVTCKPCHHFKPADVAANCAKLVPDQASTVHAVPPFE